jgi:hypothetical protein
MAKSIHTIQPGQVLTVTPTGNVQVYRVGAASAGGFLASATTYGPFASARDYVVDGCATVSCAAVDPSAFRGTFTCNGASAVTVANANILATDDVAISLNTVGGTVGAIPRLDTITPGTGFTVKGTASDTSIYNYAIIRNAV